MNELNLSKRLLLRGLRSTRNGYMTININSSGVYLVSKTPSGNYAKMLILEVKDIEADTVIGFNTEELKEFEAFLRSVKSDDIKLEETMIGYKFSSEGEEYEYESNLNICNALYKNPKLSNDFQKPIDRDLIPSIKRLNDLISDSEVEYAEYLIIRKIGDRIVVEATSGVVYSNIAYKIESDLFDHILGSNEAIGIHFTNYQDLNSIITLLNKRSTHIGLSKDNKYIAFYSEGVVLYLKFKLFDKTLKYESLLLQTNKLANLKYEVVDNALSQIEGVNRGATKVYFYTNNNILYVKEITADEEESFIDHKYIKDHIYDSDFKAPVEIAKGIILKNNYRFHVKNLSLVMTIIKDFNLTKPLINIYLDEDKGILVLDNFDHVNKSNPYVSASIKLVHID